MSDGHHRPCHPGPVSSNGSLGRFDEMAVLVTGAGHGIGRACARRLASEGARVVVADLDLDAAQEVAAQLTPARGAPAARHLGLRVDVTRTADVDEAVGHAAAALGGLDVVVNVAGGATLHPPFDELGDEVWTQMLELNLLGTVRVCRAALPHLRRSTRHPAIVNISSVNGLTALGDEPHSAAKAAISSLTANLAVHVADAGIRVNAVAPGTVRTRVWDSQPGGADQMRDLYPLGRVGEPEDIAAAVAFLASTDAAWVTGHTVPVDGGLLITHRRP